MKFVLASDSPRRHELLSQFDLNIIITPHSFDEGSISKTIKPKEYCKLILDNSENVQTGLYVDPEYEEAVNLLLNKEDYYNILYNKYHFLFFYEWYIYYFFDIIYYIQVLYLYQML